MLIEFEYDSRNFLQHMHDMKDCDLIVCWKHTWKECPVEVIELSRLFGKSKNMMSGALYYNVLFNDMDKQTVSFRLDADKVDALDSLAKTLDRDRTYLLNQAIEAYLDVQQWQLEHIRAGIRQADAGNLLDHAQVKRRAGKWRGRR